MFVSTRPRGRVYVVQHCFLLLGRMLLQQTKTKKSSSDQEVQENYNDLRTLYLDVENFFQGLATHTDFCTEGSLSTKQYVKKKLVLGEFFSQKWNLCNHSKNSYHKQCY